MTAEQTSETNEESLEDILREFAPADEPWPTLPAFHPDSDWEFRTVCRRTMPGRTDETGLCPSTGEEIPLSEPHICVTARRDQFPDTPSTTAEYKEFLFWDAGELRQWFEDEGE